VPIMRDYTAGANDLIRIFPFLITGFKYKWHLLQYDQIQLCAMLVSNNFFRNRVDPIAQDFAMFLFQDSGGRLFQL
jgi:hypothetical protein